MIGAEETVHPGKHGGEVFVDGTIEGVVPMMKGGGGDEPFERAQAPGYIRMNVEAPDGADQEEEQRNSIQRVGDGVGQTQHVHRDEAADTGEDHIERMVAGVDQPIHGFSAVMDSMEAPKQGNLMGPAVAPVESKFTDDEGGGEANGER